MALDPSIILGVNPVRVKPYDASEGLIKGLTLANALQQNKTGELQQRSLEQAYNDDLSLRTIYQNAGGDAEAVRRGLAEKGLYKQLNEFEKNQLAIKKDQASIDKDLSAISKDTLEMDIKKLDIIRNVGMGPLQAYKAAIAKGVSPEVAMQAVQPMWEAAVGQLKSNPIFDEKFLSQVPPQFDPMDIEAQLSQSLEYSDVLNNELQRRGQDITMRGQDMSAETTRRGQDISAATTRRGQDISASTTIRGQNLTNERAKEKNANDKGKAKNLTEQQGKAALFSSRAEQAHKIIEGLEGDYSPLAINAKTAAGRMPLVGGGAEAVGNLMLGENSQKAEQAQRDFVNAILRQESGAVIAETEFDNARKQYFPQPGDSEAVIKQKKENRETAIAGLKTIAGPAASPSNDGWSVTEVK